jgi:hypothetical protein
MQEICSSPEAALFFLGFHGLFLGLLLLLYLGFCCSPTVSNYVVLFLPGLVVFRDCCSLLILVVLHPDLLCPFLGLFFLRKSGLDFLLEYVALYNGLGLLFSD